VDVSQIKDDRGNPATKNLFVAGYGPGTTEQQLKDCFGQYVSVVSIVLKNTFAFVNTVDKEAAVLARSSLLGQLLNGGPLRINFAKESGRLGTSFDLGYHGPTGASASAYGPGRY
jgi:RNA recognition motif-containing protein